MTFEEFQNKYNIKLNRQQADAVQSVEGPVLLLAVPGSGKTTVLVTRLGYMIYCKKIAPENIVKKYFLQPYTDRDSVLCTGLHTPEKADLLAFQAIISPCVREARIRGSE